MFSRKNKWKYKAFNKVLIPVKKIIKMANKPNVYLYDNRVKEEFDEGHIKYSLNVRHRKLKQEILKKKRNDKIILLGYEERTNAAIASWARYEGYKKVYLIEGGMNHIDKTLLMKTEQEK